MGLHVPSRSRLVVHVRGRGSGGAVGAPAASTAPSTPPPPPPSPRRPPAAARACCCCCASAAAAHPFRVAVTVLLVAAALAAAGWFLFPRTNVGWAVSGLRATALAPPPGPGAPFLPIFAASVLANVTLTNPNYVPFTLTDVQVDVHHAGSPLGAPPVLSVAAATGPLVVPGGAPAAPASKTFTVHLTVDVGTGEGVSVAPATACARDLVGTTGGCALSIYVSTQPVYLGVGAPVVPRVTFSFPIVLRPGSTAG
jgi:hypothetical protein